MSSFKTQKKGLQPGTVLIGENGLPVDTIATIAGSNQIIAGTTQPITYSAGVVTAPVGTDLTPVRFHKTRYTGRLILVTREGATYYIDKVTVDPVTRTFNIYDSLDYSAAPSSIDLAAGWIIAEAEIVNRLATTSQAKIDNIEFRDLQFDLDIDGSEIIIKGTNGNTLEPNADGSITVQGTVQADVDFTATNAILEGIDAELVQANATLDAIAADVGDTADSAESIDNKLDATNSHLSDISTVLSQPIQIQNPVVAAGTANGDPNGTPVVFINNIKNQILAAHDRQQEIIYADFGTKNQRVVEIIYTSATFPLFTATKTFTYTLVGNRYRRDTITWSVT